MVEIETPRLRLRAFDPADLDRFAAINGDPEVRRYMWDGILTREQSATELTRIIEAHRSDGWDYLAVVDRATEQFIGQCGLFISDGGRRASLAYLLDKTHWGHGIAPEAARAYLDFAMGRLPLEQITAVTPAEHAASRRVMEKLGMRYLKDGGRRGQFDVVIYAATPQTILSRQHLHI